MEKKKHLENNHFPHIGQLIEQQTRASRRSNAEIAKKIGVSPIGFARYFDQESIQFRILWKISLALKYNFLAHLMDYFPDEVLQNSQSNSQKTIEVQATEIADLKKEILIYREILKR
jgi:hypothetical protein